MTGELQNSYSLWFSEVAVAVVTCCLRWYFHVIGKENRKAACDLILYRVEGKSLTNSIRGYPEIFGGKERLRETKRGEASQRKHGSSSLLIVSRVSIAEYCCRASNGRVLVK
ncbi:uncharacterized protein [Pocillopora verrucosa]|uniref:uncharacterized protein n=1 Tax=Pocillopora verrucosa TaxID=203993 RepID=UPI00333E4F49